MLDGSEHARTRAGPAHGPDAVVESTSQPHPLDPLGPAEVVASAQACRNYALHLPLPPLRFNSICAKEPNKHAVLAHLSDPQSVPAPPRLVLAILQAPPRDVVIEATIDLGARPPAVLSWKEMEGVQPTVTLDDVLEAEVQLKANAGFRAFVRERYGLVSEADLDLLACDPWYSGVRFGAPAGRVLQFFLYLRSSPSDNLYAHPLDCVVFYDVYGDEVTNITTYGGAGPARRAAIPARDSNFHRDLIDVPWRSGIKPLNVAQPEGPSFTLSGSEVAWQNWSFRIGFSWREGLILYNIGYEDQGRVRPVAYRAALAEIIVPYGDPRSPYDKKCAYDIVDYGLGMCANSLELGCDCLGHIQYLDAVVNNSKGEPVIIKKAVCMHEEDVGIAFKHMDYRSGDTEVRRLRRLVVSFIATIANYEYGFYYSLYQDGTIQFDVKLTGIVSTHALYPEERGEPSNGILVLPDVVAHHHQHFFCFRLDMSVDDPTGSGLSVVEVDTEPMPLGPQNPHGIGFVVKETVLRTEQEAQRMCAPERARAWKVVNPRVINPNSGKPVAWKLTPTWSSPPLLAHPQSVHATRGAFSTKHLWVTPYAEAEMNPAGDYPCHPDPQQNQGLQQWTEKNRSVVDADVVIWPVVGLTHIVRPEDFPVMPCEVIGFSLKPFGFFSRNPAVDLPPTRNKASREATGGGCCSVGAAGKPPAPPRSKL